ncbi:MAG: thioredoxin domain-containing protein [Rubrivivax sp.]|nr:thioredoxin domain-containing protein [Rubrivivax sp.]
MSRKSQRNQPAAPRTVPNPPPAALAAAPGQGGQASRRGLLIAAGAAVVAAAGAGGYFAFGGRSAPATRPELLSADAPTMGPATAKVHIVEFLDPACETCAVFYPLVKRIVADNPDKIRLSVRHVPFHRGSEDVVRMLEASRKQDRYWPALEALLASQNFWAPNHTAQPALALQAISGVDVGLDLVRLAADMREPEVDRRIAQDGRDAAALQVTKTPEYFVNGRQMASFGRQQLQALINDALQRAY